MVDFLDREECPAEPITLSEPIAELAAKHLIAGLLNNEVMKMALNSKTDGAVIYDCTDSRNEDQR